MDRAIRPFTSPSTHEISAAGLAFSEEERERLYLRGLLPPAVLSQEVQAERALVNIRSKQNDLDKHTYLSSLQVDVASYSKSSLHLSPMYKSDTLIRHKWLCTSATCGGVARSCSHCAICAGEE